MSSRPRFNRVERVRPLTSITQVLLTGPTGFFGPFLLRSLLHQTRCTFHALTRATDPAAGMERIRMALRRAGVWTPDLDAELKQRVHGRLRRLALSNLGLRTDHWHALAGQVQAVVHNAAQVNYVMNYEALRAPNVPWHPGVIALFFRRFPKNFISSRAP